MDSRCSIGKDENKEGFHMRFQQINETTIQETDQFGHTRHFVLNKKSGIWEAKGSHLQKTELTIVEKDLFSVKETYSSGSYETILYSPGKKIREMFVRGSNGKPYLAERTNENLNGICDCQVFDEEGHMIEQKVSDNWTVRKWVRNGRVLIGDTKSSSKASNLVKINSPLTR